MFFQAFAEQQPGAMQPDAEVAFAQGEHSAELGGLQVFELSQDEYLGERGRQTSQTAVDHLPELAILEGLLGRLPRDEGRLPQSFRGEISTENGIGASARLGSRRLRWFRGSTVMIDNLVPQDRQKPGANARPPLESFLRLESRQESLLHQIFRQLPVADPGTGIPIQGISVLGQPCRGIAAG